MGDFIRAIIGAAIFMTLLLLMALRFRRDGSHRTGATVYPSKGIADRPAIPRVKRAITAGHFCLSLEAGPFFLRAAIRSDSLQRPVPLGRCCRRAGGDKARRPGHRRAFYVCSRCTVSTHLAIWEMSSSRLTA